MTLQGTAVWLAESQSPRGGRELRSWRWSLIWSSSAEPSEGGVESSNTASGGGKLSGCLAAALVDGAIAETGGRTGHPGWLEGRRWRARVGGIQRQTTNRRTGRMRQVDNWLRVHCRAIRSSERRHLAAHLADSEAVIRRCDAMSHKMDADAGVEPRARRRWRRMRRRASQTRPKGEASKLEASSRRGLQSVSFIRDRDSSVGALAAGARQFNGRSGVRLRGLPHAALSRRRQVPPDM